MDITRIQTEKQHIIDQIKKYGPQLASFFDVDLDLRQYAQRLYETKISEPRRARQELIRKKMRAKLITLFGENYERILNVNLQGPLIFNIADHHQVLNHPMLISSNVLSSVHKFFQPTKQDAAIVISSGDVPPNNYFSLNGFQLHNKRVPLFSASEREYTSYFLPLRDFNFIDRLKKANRWNEFDADEQSFLTEEYARIQSFDFSRCANYSDQISTIVKNTWPRLFEESVRPTLPELIYITQEELVSECLLDLLKEDNIMSACLFDPAFRMRVLNNFRGIVVTWREEVRKGTHFFWRKYPGQPRSLRMYVEGDTLVPADPRFKELAVPLRRETLIELLEKKEIYPSLFTIFTVLNFYAGVKPLVGYGSVVYLDLMKRAWVRTVRESGMMQEAEIIESIDTNGFIAGLAIFFKRTGEKLQTLYAHDIFYDGGIRREYLERLFEMKFKDVASAAVADMYDYYAQKYIPLSAEQLKPKINFNDLASLTFDWVS